MNRQDTVLGDWELGEAVLRHGYKAQQKIEDRSSCWSLAKSSRRSRYYVSFRPTKWAKEMPTQEQVFEMLSQYGRWNSVLFVGVSSWEKNKKGEEIPNGWHWIAVRSEIDMDLLALQNRP